MNEILDDKSISYRISNIGSDIYKNMITSIEFIVRVLPIFIVTEIITKGLAKYGWQAKKVAVTLISYNYH